MTGVLVRTDKHMRGEHPETIEAETEVG